VLLLTGATGSLGSALLRRLTSAGAPVRCLVREPRRLGAERVRVQIALGDLADPQSLRHLLRGVTTAVHLAASERDQPHASIEELDGLATWRLVRAAERAGVERLVFVTPLGATLHHAARVQRAKALAEQAVAASSLATATVASSLMYAPGDRRLRMLERLAWLPAVPVAGLGRSRIQPIWIDDVADALTALLARAPAGGRERIELAGPEVLTHREMVERVLAAAGRPRPLVPVPTAAARRLLRAYETAAGPTALATWDELEFVTASMTTERGTADAEGLGVRPRRLEDVLRR
jgi:NADH dehydrogenase